MSYFFELFGLHLQDIAKKQIIMGISFIGIKELPRGLRDNNPGNIRPSKKYKWNGQIGIEGGYVIFVDIEHGIRAMAKDLVSKINRGLNEIALYVPIYAPAGDNNDPKSYIDLVSKLSGFAPNELLIANPSTIYKLVKAHIVEECGANNAELIPDTSVLAGVNMAFGQ